jgi:hypothetical protein
VKAWRRIDWRAFVVEVILTGMLAGIGGTEWCAVAWGDGTGVTHGWWALAAMGTGALMLAWAWTTARDAFRDIVLLVRQVDTPTEDET